MNDLAEVNMLFRMFDADMIAKENPRHILKYGLYMLYPEHENEVRRCTVIPTYRFEHFDDLAVMAKRIIKEVQQEIAS